MSNLPIGKEYSEGFKRAFLEAMRNMGMITTYAAGATFLYAKSKGGTSTDVLIRLGGSAIYCFSLVGASFTVELFLPHAVRRFPEHLSRPMIMWAFLIVIAVVAATPSILVWARM